MRARLTVLICMVLLLNKDRSLLVPTRLVINLFTVHSSPTPQIPDPRPQTSNLTPMKYQSDFIGQAPMK